MKMRKVIVAFLAAVCILASTCAFGASAEGTRRVYAETSLSAEQGEYGYCYVYLNDLTDLASLQVAVHYDPERITVIDSYNQVEWSLYDSSNQNGCLQYSYIFDGEGSNEKTNLFYFFYQVNENADIGNTYFDIVVSDAYDSSLESVAIGGSRCNFSVTEKTETKTAYVYGSSDIQTSVKEEIEITYSLSDSQIASGSLLISYDPELFEFVELQSGAFFDGKLVDVNTSQSGAVYLSFLATEYNYNTDLLKIKLRTRKNVTEHSEVKLTVSELYDLALNRIACDGYTTNVAVTHDAAYAEDAPSVSLSASYNAQTDKVTVTVLLDKNSRLGAGDFVLSFDKNSLTYSSAQKEFSPSFFNLNDKSVSEGVLKFSIISLTDITDGQTVLTVVFDVKHACEDKYVDFEIGGSGLADSLTNPILLNFVDAGVTVPFRHVDGNDNNHLCDNGCGEIADDGCCDNDTNHACDECGATGMGEHADSTDSNHLCDYGCRQIADDGCHDVNTDADHKCDECGEDNVTAHIDGNDNNHLCDNGCGEIADDGCCDNDTNHACDECGKTNIGIHEDSITDNDHVCDYGCGATLENCLGGTATCTALAVCTICEKPYGDYAAHTFGIVWDYKVSGGHAHVCTLSGCNAHDEIQAHTPNIPAATEDEAQVCEDCGYQMAAQLNHTHNATSEWTSNTTHHWKACSGCFEHIDEAPHTHTNDCDTTCNVCGETRTVTHDFSGAWQKDADGHWHECTGCDEEELDKSAHNDGDNNGKCDICDYTMSRVDPEPPADPESSGENDGLSTGAIVGIAASSVATIGGGFGIFWFIIRRKRIF